MRAFVTIATLLLAAAGAPASDVYKTTDAQGRPIYTDKPQTLPAQRLDVATASTDVVEVQKRYADEMKSYSAEEKAQAEAEAKAKAAQQAGTLSAADKAKRCQEARQRYESYMNARRIYEPGATDTDRRYLDSAEIDDARADAKRVMDEFCSGQ